MTDSHHAVVAPLAAALISAVLIGWLGWPAVVAPGAWVLGGGGGDFPSIAWGLWRTAEAVPWVPTHFPDIFYPQGADLLPADLPAALLLAPLTMWFGPVVAFNVLQCGHAVLTSAVAAALFANRGRMAATVGGVSLGMSTVLLSGLHNGNPDVTPLFWLPWVALCAQRTQRGWHWAILAGLGVGLAVWSNPYVGVMAGLVGLLFSPWKSLRSVVAGGIGLGMSVCFWLAVSSTLQSPEAMIAKPPVDVRLPAAGAADVVGWLWPAPRHPPDGWSVHMWFPGWSVLVLAMLGWRGGRRWWVLVVSGVLLSLGPILQLTPDQPLRVGGHVIALPLRWLGLLPGLANLHIHYRFAALAILGLGGLAAAGTARLPPWMRAVAVAAVVGELGAWGAPMLSAGPSPDTTACALLSDLPPGAVLDLPGSRQELRLFAQHCHGRAVAEGVNRPYPGRVRHTLSAGLDAVHALGFRYVIVHPDTGEALPPSERLVVADLLEEATRREMVVAESAGISIIDLEAP